MPFNRSSLTDLVQRVENDVISRLGTGTPTRAAASRVLARAMAGAVHELYGYLDFISRQVIPDTAEGEYLEGWAATFGVTRTAATFAAGDVTFTGTDGSTIPTGTAVQLADGTEYTTTADGVIASGTADVSVSAGTAGAAGNVEAGVTVTLTSPVAGVDATGTVVSITGGADVESDEDLLARLLARIQTPPRGGSAADYENWALEVAGVTRAFVFPLRYGTGTVGVTFVRDDDANLIPDAAEVQAVQDYINERRPVTADVTVFAPVPVEIDLTIKLQPNTAEVQAAVTAELEDVIFRTSEPDGFVYVSKLDEAISIAEGENDHEITVTTPAAVNGRIVAAEGELLVAGTFTFEDF